LRASSLRLDGALVGACVIPAGDKTGQRAH
jgi:hypothetical protein